VVVSTPLKNRQLGIFFPTEWNIIKFMFQTTKQLMLSNMVLLGLTVVMTGMSSDG
jgi:hypothetical protein